MCWLACNLTVLDSCLERNICMNLIFLQYVFTKLERKRYFRLVGDFERRWISFFLSCVRCCWNDWLLVSLLLTLVNQESYLLLFQHLNMLVLSIKHSGGRPIRVVVLVGILRNLAWPLFSLPGFIVCRSRHLYATSMYTFLVSAWLFIS